MRCVADVPKGRGRDPAPGHAPDGSDGSRQPTSGRRTGGGRKSVERAHGEHDGVTGEPLAGTGEGGGVDGVESDAALVDRVRAGDDTAYSELWSRHEPAARRLAARVAAPSDVDDLVSESFTRTLDALRGGGGPDTAFRPYLLSTLRRANIDVARRYTNRVVLTDDETTIDTRTAASAEDEAVDAEEQRRRVGRLALAARRVPVAALASGRARGEAAPDRSRPGHDRPTAWRAGASARVSGCARRSCQSSSRTRVSRTAARCDASSVATCATPCPSGPASASTSTSTGAPGAARPCSMSSTSTRRSGCASRRCCCPAPSPRPPEWALPVPWGLRVARSGCHGRGRSRRRSSGYGRGGHGPGRGGSGLDHGRRRRP